MADLMKNIVLDNFAMGTVFSRKELYDYYLKKEPDLKESTFAWRIYDLKKRGIISQIRKSTYIVSGKHPFQLGLSEFSLELLKKNAEHFKDIRYCAWEPSCLNEFSQHIIFSDLLILEVEKDILESAYFHLKDSSYQNIFIKPDLKTMEYYVAESDRPVILKPLITRSPLKSAVHDNYKYYTPALEKILVDIIADNNLFYFLEGTETEGILMNAFDKYHIDKSALINYAARRGKKEIMIAYVNKYLE